MNHKASNATEQQQVESEHPLPTTAHQHTYRFMAVICGDSLPTFQTFADKKNAPNLAKIFHGKTKKNGARLQALSEAGAGVFLMVNEGNGTKDGEGRKAENVIRVRAVFVDLDGSPIEPVIPYSPHLVIESSPGRFHAYWRLSDCPLDKFTPIQKALAVKFDGDPAVHDLSRVMRIPGFPHQKGDPVEVKIIQDNYSEPISLDEFLSCLDLDLGKPEPLKPKESISNSNTAYGQRALNDEVMAVICAENGGRNTQLNKSAFALGQLIAGGEVDESVVLDALTKAADGNGLDANEIFITIKSGLDAGKQKPRNVSQQQNSTSGPLSVVIGSTVTPKHIEWLWKGWVARKKLHIVSGIAGTGKTTIAINIGSTFTHGGILPDRTLAPQCDVAMWSGEDDIDDTLVPRFIAAGADMDHVHLIDGKHTNGVKKPFDPATDLPELKEYLLAHPKIKFLIIDPIVSVVTNGDKGNAEVRRDLQPVVDMGIECDCAIIGIHHFNKGSGGNNPVERVSGSLAFGAVARILMAAAKINDDSLPKGTCLFVRTKSNIGPDDGGWHYQLNKTELTAHPGVVVGEVIWGDSVQGSAQQLLSAAETIEDDLSSRDEAKTFLKGELSNGPKPANKLFDDAYKVGISKSTLKRAKASLKIRSEKSDFDGGWEWHLPKPHPGQQE